MKIYDAFGPPPPTLPPSTLVRRWDTAAVFAGMAAGVGYACAFALTNAADWRAGVASAALAILAGSAGLRPHSRLVHVSGPQLREGKDAEREARRVSKAEGDPLVWLHPLLGMTRERLTRHVLLYGSVGSGKTQILLRVLEQVWRSRNIKSLAYDVKGDLTLKAGKRAVVLSPWLAGSRVWDIAQDVRTQPQAAVFSQAIVPSNAEGAGNPFFPLAAQQIVFGVVRSLQLQRGTDWGWQELAERLRLDRAGLVALFRVYHPLALQLIGDETDASSSVLATVAANTTCIQNLALSWGHTAGRKRFSFSRWLADDYRGRGHVIVQGGPDPQLTAAYIGAAVRLIEATVNSPAMADSTKRLILVSLDEYPSLRCDISSLAELGRSKGVGLLIGVQALPQLAAFLGQEKAKTLPSLVGTQIACRIQMGETRDQVAAQFGRERVAIIGHSQSGSGASVSTHEETRAVVESAYLSSLGVQRHKRWQAGFAIRGLVSGYGSDPLVLDFPGLVLPDRGEPFEPAAWTLPTKPADAKQDATPPVPSSLGALRDRIASGEET